MNGAAWRDRPRAHRHRGGAFYGAFMTANLRSRYTSPFKAGSRPQHGGLQPHAQTR